MGHCVVEAIVSAMSSTSNNSGTNSNKVPRDDTKAAKKAEASKTNNPDHITLEQFLGETEEGVVTGADGPSDAEVTTQDSAGKIDGGKNGDGSK
ncbi:hypothetical protein SLS60_000913 [Paraconiothyrium brasiliense]|uniref:Uncharacterized protein n=1 Tax=Paraconiothyrium brasiliense TaxID=300254 RepID=A0ABR3S7L7_9PLEO